MIEVFRVGLGKRIVRAEIIDNGQAIKCHIDENVCLDAKQFETMFPIVDIEGISLEDSFMKYEPKDITGRRVKTNIIEAKRIGMKNFRVPAIDPSFADDGETIIYSVGREPAVGKPASWWEENAPNFMPEKNSQIINDLEQDVWAGTVIKNLIEEKEYEIDEAWETACIDSKKIVYDDTDPIDEETHELELTGSGTIGKWMDLANTMKIVKKHVGLGYVLYSAISEEDVGYWFPFAIAEAHNYPCMLRGVGQPVKVYATGRIRLDV